MSEAAEGEQSHRHFYGVVVRNEKKLLAMVEAKDIEQALTRGVRAMLALDIEPEAFVLVPLFSVLEGVPIFMDEFFEDAEQVQGACQAGRDVIH